MMNRKHLFNGEVRGNVGYEDFKKVFKVFEEYPFNESWTDEEVREEYAKFTSPGGKVFGYYIDDKCVGMITLHPMIPNEHPVRFEEGKKVMYLSDVATLKEHRGHGIGTELFKWGLQYTESEGYDYIYLRTNFDERESMSAGIAKKCGFIRNWEYCQEVERIRADGNIGTDLRMFMEKKLK